MKPDLKKNNGNALFLILIAVALFAALSYAITQSGRGGGSADKEKRQIQVSQMVQQATAIEQAINKLKLMRGCSDTDLNFDNPVRTGYTNGALDSPCSLFHPSGGGLNWVDFTKVFSGTGIGQEDIVMGNEVQGVGTTCGGDNCADLLFIVTFQDENSAALDICNTINKLLGHDFASPPIDTNISTGSNFAGTYTYSATLGDEDANLSGLRAACIQETTGGGNDYRFYHVVLAR